MIDPYIIRERPDDIRRMLQSRVVDYDLNELILCEQERRRYIADTDKLRQERNDCGKTISELKKSREDATDMINHMKRVSAELRAQESMQTANEEKYQRLIRAMPNMIHDTVPLGPDDTTNVEINRWGLTDSKPKNHVDVAGDLLDIERAAKVAGSRFYYLKDGLVRLNYAIISYALDHLLEYGYTLVQPPYMINRQSMEGAIIAEDFEDVIYKIQDKDLYMVGTSEHAMAAMHSDEIMDGHTLPVRYAGVSPCFRKEAGAHGKDQKGIFRVHQFEKVEQFVYARPEQSWVEHQRMLRISEKFYESLSIPYRTVILSSGDMGKVASKTYDIEAWMAGQSAYREIVSCSNCTDYQARRLMIRYRDRTNDKPQYLHTLNSTLVATTRTMVAIMENHQRRDGHIDVPKPLQSYMNLKII
ncbi:MAG: serine--tRNA ligase [Cenarchaeum sp. SB0663_bin_5]|nr:serine--tRNA ligase [Cenarchaeum sp. SB0663_bin_5]MYH04441.1 serine--tRNA ligase [Cenarchaeum sp. SB0675_bin_21]MYL11813.1 serine--tRNA ligase [Cenarchaeum sp. SB0669_bin_11]